MAEDRRSNEGQQGGGERRFFAKPKFCQFCADKTLTIDYKKTDLLRKYITDEAISARAAKPERAPDINASLRTP